MKPETKHALADIGMRALKTGGQTALAATSFVQLVGGISGVKAAVIAGGSAAYSVIQNGLKEFWARKQAKSE
jgi:hypothetical protein